MSRGRQTETSQLPVKGPIPAHNLTENASRPTKAGHPDRMPTWRCRSPLDGRIHQSDCQNITPNISLNLISNCRRLPFVGKSRSTSIKPRKSRSPATSRKNRTTIVAKNRESHVTVPNARVLATAEPSFTATAGAPSAPGLAMLETALKARCKYRSGVAGPPASLDVGEIFRESCKSTPRPARNRQGYSGNSRKRQTIRSRHLARAEAVANHIMCS